VAVAEPCREHGMMQDLHNLGLGESALLHSESPRSGSRENSTHKPR
jgi:hypothetical protein